ncbi:hypothetical protein CVT26_000623 [Gymnopilus dilepis]|uniref:Terpene synthase n=1 Tax=Gymnopilus dilepis TaxID=231916 RepID=A0A409Y287_9AGAR|nr:hypothetical protein CVT26_000623 [Gymnopilus dilepis]
MSFWIRTIRCKTKTTMGMFTFRPFPPSFRLKNLAEITSRAFPLKVNPNGSQVHETMRDWFMKFNVYDAARTLAYIDRGRFDVFAALSFPDADIHHLETCLAFFYWAFATDDLSDEDNLQAKPEDVEAGIEKSRQAFTELTSSDHPYAMMLNELPCAFEAFGSSEVKQSLRRSENKMLSVSEFIITRRDTIGAPLVEAMIEYSLDLKIPDYVFDDPIVIAMSQATTDIMTWPNKEQADGDFQNLVCCIMVEYQVELQEAIDILVDMVRSRVDEYVNLEAQLPSFGHEVDQELSKYHTALEHFVQGTVVWYYLSPRYFASEEFIEYESTVVELKPQSEL